MSDLPTLPALPHKKYKLGDGPIKYTYTELYSGRRLYFLNPQPEQFTIEDIAHGLALTCRYNGQCKTFYSVAEHCIWVASSLPNSLKKAGLLHDAPEAFMGDMVSPLKQHMPKFSEIEDKIHTVVNEKYGIKPLSDVDKSMLKMVDMQVRMTEARVLMKSQGAEWSEFGDLEEIEGVNIKQPMPWEQAEFFFLQGCSELGIYD